VPAKNPARPQILGNRQAAPDTSTAADKRKGATATRQSSQSETEGKASKNLKRTRPAEATLPSTKPDLHKVRLRSTSSLSEIPTPSSSHSPQLDENAIRFGTEDISEDAMSSSNDPFGRSSAISRTPPRTNVQQTKTITGMPGPSTTSEHTIVLLRWIRVRATLKDLAKINLVWL
jgi:hypothetical protein